MQSTKLTLIATGHRQAGQPLHISTRWRNGPRATHTVCGIGLNATGMRTLALPFRGWTQALCADCGAWMDQAS